MSPNSFSKTSWKKPFNIYLGKSVDTNSTKGSYFLGWGGSPGPLDFHESGQITKVLKPELIGQDSLTQRSFGGERPGRGRYNLSRVYGL